MKIIVYTSIAPNSLDRFPLKTSSINGWEIENRPCKVTPQQGLTEWMLGCWKEIIGKEQEEVILIFKHNDFEVLDEVNFLSQITGLIQNGSADLIGVAGTVSFDPIQRKPNGSYLNWSEYEPTDQKAGLIMRSINGLDLWTFFGKPGLVKIIDGCCMVCSGRLAPKIENLLTPKFHRDWYDLSFSYNAFKAGFKVYVINSLVRHESGGEFGLNWLKEGHEFFAHFSQPESVSDAEALTPEVKITEPESQNGHSDQLRPEGEAGTESA